MDNILADLIQKYLEDTRLKAIVAFAEIYDCPPDEVETMLEVIGPDSPTVTWACWRRGSFHVSNQGLLDIGIVDAELLS